MTTTQSIALCRVFEMEPDAPCGAEPRYIAVQRIFDADGADLALYDHEERSSARPVKIKNIGTHATNLASAKGGSK